MHAKAKQMVQTCWFALSATAFFFVYGGGRTMHESPEFSANGFWFGILLAGYISVLLLSVHSLIYILKERQPPSINIVVPYAIAALLGIVVSEATITADELAFKKEIAALAESPDPEESHYRNRAWPNGGCQLYWSSSRGFWATD